MSVADLEAPTAERGGVFVVQRLADGSTWDGEKWVAGWDRGLHYPPAPADGPTRARVEADRLEAGGEPCCVIYVALRSRSTSRSLPLPTLALGA